MNGRRHLLCGIIALIGALPLAAAFETLYAELKPILRPRKPKPGATKIEFDEAGVPWVDYGGDLGRQRNPVAVAQEALKHWDRSKEGDQEALDKFFACAEWLVEHPVRRDGHAIYEYTFDWPMYGMKAPWRSALAQGQALQVLTRAHAVRKDERYLKTAREVLGAFFVAVGDGGVTYTSESEGWWFEEASAKDARETRVLNGMMGSLIGIHEFHRHSGDGKAKELFERGILALTRALPDYDCPEQWTSYYDLLKDPAGRDYHELHIRQLSELIEITGMPTFREYRDKWQGYVSDAFLVLLFREPTARRIRSVLVAFGVIFLLGEGIVWFRRRRVRS